MNGLTDIKVNKTVIEMSDGDTLLHVTFDLTYEHTLVDGTIERTEFKGVENPFKYGNYKTVTVHKAPLPQDRVKEAYIILEDDLAKCRQMNRYFVPPTNPITNCDRIGFNGDEIITHCGTHDRSERRSAI